MPYLFTHSLKRVFYKVCGIEKIETKTLKLYKLSNQIRIFSKTQYEHIIYNKKEIPF